MKSGRTRHAMAIPLVIILTSLMLTGVLVLWQASHDDMPRALLDVGRLQARYVALGAIQHALLKVKLLPTQAYDAAAYAVGKNPYFNHTSGTGGGYEAIKKLVDNPADTSVDPHAVKGPAFLAGTYPGTVVWFDADKAWRNSAARDVDLSGTEDQADHVGGQGANPWICEQYLLEFAEDVKADTGLPVHFVRGQTDAVTGLEDPFDATYLVRQIKVIAQLGERSPGVVVGGRKHSQEAVRILVSATVKGRTMEAKTMKDKDYSADLETIVKVQRTPQ